MTEKRIVIIGAGIAGLAAGCYARMNGYEPLLLESHDKPGGLCTAWMRRGYTIDGCIHWLTGSAPNDSLYQVWEELGAVQGRPMLDHDVFVRFVERGGRTLSLYVDPDRLERHLKELSPCDGVAISELCALVRKFARLSFPLGKPREIMSPLDGIRFAFRLRHYLKDLAALGQVPLRQYAERFADPLLRTALTESIGRDSPAIAFAITLAGMQRRSAGFPAGGSLPFARAIERRLLDLGGRIAYGARVERILVRDGHATGVQLADGSEIAADMVISACDLRTTHLSLLGGNHLDAAHRELLERGTLFPPCVQVSFGIRGEISGLGDCLNESIELDAPFDVAGRRVERLGLKSYAFDPSLAPAGKSLVVAILSTDWEAWEPLGADATAYLAEKERLATACADMIDRRYPGFRGAIEMTDVATPLTYHRYTGSWRGSFMTWTLSTDFQRRHPVLRKGVEGLDNVYLASMWTNPPGGLPSAALAGREVIQLLCRRDRRPFRTTRPS